MITAGKSSFYGQVITIKCFEDNSVVKALLDEPGLGRVIVMDGGGSLRRAILGDMFSGQTQLKTVGLVWLLMAASAIVMR